MKDPCINSDQVHQPNHRAINCLLKKHLVTVYIFMHAFYFHLTKSQGYKLFKRNIHLAILYNFTHTLILTSCVIFFCVFFMKKHSRVIVC